MATLGASYLNLLDMQKADPDVGPLGEILALTNPILDDAIAVECNDGTKHNHSIRTGLPAVAWGQIYKGIPQSKSGRQLVTDTTGFLEGRSSVDERLVELYGDRANALRLSEAMGFIEAMNQEMATGIFYANTAAAPEKFLGLGPRYGLKGGSGAGNQIVDAGGTGSDNTSVWFVTWSEWATHLLYPRGTKAGLDRQDMGPQRVLDAAGDPFFALEEIFRWHIGLAVRDWRYNVRIANIDISDLAAGSVAIHTFMRQAYYKMQSRRIARPGANFKNSGNNSIPISRASIYMNSDVLAALDAVGTNSLTSTDNYVRLLPKEIEGREVMTYRGIPIRETDALLNTEARVL